MKYRTINLGIIAISALLICACAPRPNGGPRGPKISPEALFKKADINGDKILTFEEFKASLPEKGSR